MPDTYTFIASQTVAAGGNTTISLSAIPQTYTDLILFLSTRSENVNNADAVYAQFNSSATGYNNLVSYGDTTTFGTFAPLSTHAHFGYGSGNNSTANTNNTYGNVMIYIPSYRTSTAKTCLVQSGKEAMFGVYQSGINSFQTARWSGTAAISSITLTQESTVDFAEGSTAYLYGIIRS
jgi:hypothetical protein